MATATQSEPSAAEPGAQADPPVERAGVPRTDPLSRLVGNPWFWVAFVTLMFVGIIGRTMMREPPVVPKAMFNIPKWQMTDQDGRAFGTDNLKGKVWVANFIFTSCPSICPALSEKMAYLQKHTRHAANHVHLVSFSVDPENDSPEVLKAYAQRYRANPVRWSFVVGDSKSIDEVIVKGFKLATGKEGPDLMQVFHSERFVLIDREQNVRGLYEATDEGMKKLLVDIGLVLNRTQ